MIRAVLDTNVLVSALIGSGGAPAILLTRWREGAFELVVSPALLAELVDVLGRPKIRRYVTSEEAREYVGMLGVRAISTDAAPAGISADPADDRVIGLAQSAASVLVTGDDEMLRFAVAGLAILRPRAFLEAIDG